MIPLQKPRSATLLCNKQLVMHRIVDDACRQFSIYPRSQPGRPMLEPKRYVEKGKAVGEIRRAIERIHIPAVRALEPGAGSLFSENAMLGELLVEPVDD